MAASSACSASPTRSFAALSGRGRAVERLPSLIEQFVGGEASRDQRAGAVELLLRERRPGSSAATTLALRLVEALLRLLDLRLGLLQRGLDVLRVHAGDDLPALDHVAFVGEHFGDAAGELGVDIDLVRLDPAVARYDPQGEAALPRMPPPGAAATRADDDDREKRQRSSISISRASRAMGAGETTGSVGCAGATALSEGGSTSPCLTSTSCDGLDGAEVSVSSLLMFGCLSG